jgi:hypothetical protein
MVTFPSRSGPDYAAATARAISTAATEYRKRLGSAVPGAISGCGKGAAKVTESTRKLIGTIVLLVFIGVYSLLVMVLATSRLPGMGGVASLAFYIGAGLLWVPPAAWIIRWMQRPVS